MGDIDLPLGGFIALDWTLLLFALSFLIVRIVVRRRQVDASIYVTVSDCCALAAWLSGGVLVAINTWKNSLRMKYLGQPDLFYGVPKDMSGHLLMVSYLSLFFIYISLWLSKAAFIAFYYHLFDRLGSWCRVAKIFTCAFTLLTFIVHMCLLLFWCQPIGLNWAIEEGKLCSAVHSMSSVTISTFTNIATDIVIVSLPLFLIRKLTIRTGSKWVYGFVGFMGGMSIVAALVRWGALKAVWGQPKASVTHTIDVWAMVEIVTSLIAVCLPALRTVKKEWSGGSGEQGHVPMGLSTWERKGDGHIVQIKGPRDAPGAIA